MRKCSEDEWIIDSKSGIFVPPLRARGIIARTVLYMLDEYPSLQQEVHAIIDSDALHLWQNVPESVYEVQHFHTLRRKRSYTA